MDYTQEQLDALIAEKVAEAKKGLFTEEDLTKKVTAEVDRRVETGIQKGLETQRQKWEKEQAEKLKLSAEELAQKEFEEKLKEVSSKEREIQKKANLLEAKNMLAEADIPKSKYEKVISVLVSDDENATKDNVSKFIEMYTETKTDLEAKLKEAMSNIKPPDTGKSDGITKDDFAKMGYADRLKLKKENPELYKEFTK